MKESENVHTFNYVVEEAYTVQTETERSQRILDEPANLV